MRKMLVATALALTAPLLVGVQPANAANCSSEKVVRENYDFGNSIAFVANFYKVCTGNGRTWVRPTSVILGYNKDGSSTPCGWEDAYEGVEFTKGYYFDNTGRNFTVAKKYLGCETDTTNSTVVNLSNKPRLFYSHGAPKWKYNIVEKWSWSIPDKKATISGNYPKK